MLMRSAAMLVLLRIARLPTSTQTEVRRRGDSKAKHSIVFRRKREVGLHRVAVLL